MLVQNVAGKLSEGNVWNLVSCWELRLHWRFCLRLWFMCSILIIKLWIYWTRLLTTVLKSEADTCKNGRWPTNLIQDVIQKFRGASHWFIMILWQIVFLASGGWRPWGDGWSFWVSKWITRINKLLVLFCDSRLRVFTTLQWLYHHVAFW